MHDTFSRSITVGRLVLLPLGYPPTHRGLVPKWKVIKVNFNFSG